MGILSADYFNFVGRFISSSLFRSAGVYTVVNVTDKAILFLMLPILTRYLTPSDYGIISMFGVLLGGVGVFTGLGTLNSVFRKYFERDTIDLPNYITNCIYILVVSSVAMLLILYFFSDWLENVTAFPSNWNMIVLEVAVATFMIQLLLNLWQAQVGNIRYGIFQILLTLTNVSLSILLVVFLKMNWEGRIKAQVISSTLFACLAILFLWKGGWFKWGLNVNYIRNALKIGVPLVPHTIGGLLIETTDRILITNMISVAHTGVYVVGAQVGMIILLFTSSFNMAWVPWLFERLNKDDYATKHKIVIFTYAYCVMILIAALSLAALAPWFFSFFVGENFADSSNYVIWIALGHAFGGMYMMVTNYIFYVNKTYLLAWGTFFTAVVNIFSSYWFIQWNGAIGAAQGTMLAYLFSFILTWILSAKVYKMPWNLKR